MEREDIKMAYLAGVMDGDGSFSVIKRKSACSPLYFPLLQCASWRTFVKLLKDTFGGSLTTPSRIHICKDGSEGNRLIHWKLRGQGNVKPILEKLIPFLKVKKERAEHLLTFIKQNPFVRGQILSSEILENRERSYLKMIQFNEWRSCFGNITKKISKTLSNDKIFWSYLGGLFDTEGSFSVKKQVQNKGTDVKNPRYLPVISLSMTDTRAINYLRENCNLGKLYIPKNKGTSAGYHYQFGIYTKNESIQFLNMIIPYLYSKKENAKVLLEFCEKSKNTKYCKAGISNEELEFRENCYIKLKSLNKYGVIKPSLIDLEVLKQDDRAEDESHRERLNERASKEDAIV